jgi:hypothetical protein
MFARAPAEVTAPVPPLAIARVPVTPVAIERPTALVRVKAEGVPKLGVTRVGLVDKTVLPVPVAVVTPVPPLATGSVPVTPVVRGNPVALVRRAKEGAPKLGEDKIGLVAKTTAPVPVATPVPVPPCVRDSGVVKPDNEVMSALAPEAAAPKLVRAAPAVIAPVPPFAIGRATPE